LVVKDGTVLVGTANVVNGGGKKMQVFNDTMTQSLEVRNQSTVPEGNKYAINATVDTTGATNNIALFGWATGATNNYGLYIDQGLGYFNGNVGIGTTAPTHRLDVTGGGAVIRSSLTVTGAGLSGTQTAFEVIGGTMTVRYDGNVGIGTTSPIDRLHVSNGVIRSDFNGAGSSLNTLSMYLVSGDPGIGFRNTGTSAGYTMEASNTGGLRFATATETLGSQTNRVAFDAVGQVGIGTVTPTHRLDVTGGGAVIRSSLTVTGAGLSGTQTAFEVIGGTMTVRYDGKVGIGTTSPATKLDVNGNAQFGSGGTKSTFSVTGALSLASGAALSLSGSAGTITSASSVTASGFFGNGSKLTNIQMIIPMGVHGQNTPVLDEGGFEVIGTNGVRNRIQVDLTNYSEVKLGINLDDNGTGGTTMQAEYSTTGTSPWTVLTPTVAIDGAVPAFLQTAFAAIPAGAKADVYIRTTISVATFVGFGGVHLIVK
jgi:hypothetical protein